MTSMTCEILPHPWSLTSNFKPNNPSRNDNQSVERKHDPKVTITYYQQSSISLTDGFTV